MCHHLSEVKSCGRILSDRNYILVLNITNLKIQMDICQMRNYQSLWMKNRNEDE